MPHGVGFEPQAWMQKLVYFEERPDDWRPWMADSMLKQEGDERDTTCACAATWTCWRWTAGRS